MLVQSIEDTLYASAQRFIMERGENRIYHVKKTKLVYGRFNSIVRIFGIERDSYVVRIVGSRNKTAQVASSPQSVAGRIGEHLNGHPSVDILFSDNITQSEQCEIYVESTKRR